MSGIDWDDEIRKAKMFSLNAYCMKYIDLAEQVNEELKAARSELDSLRAAFKQATEERWLFSEKQTKEIRALALRGPEVKAVVDALKKAMLYFISDGRKGEGWYAEAQDALMKFGKMVEK